jgi:hypothetical protein
MTATEDYVPRAMAARYRSGKAGHTRAYPVEERCTHVTLLDGKSYVVLGNAQGVLAIYRVRPSGLLRLLRRWPKAVEAAAGWSGEERA